MDKLRPAPFECRLTKTETALGWCYFWIHFLVFPILFGLLVQYWPDGLDEVTGNVVYFAIGFVFCLIALHGLLRRDYDTLSDGLGRCALTVLMALGLDYILSMIVAAVIMLVQDSTASPNNELITELAGQNPGAMRAIAVFIAPVVEETLFRGVVFGSLRRKSRALAYVVSIALFSLYHVWQYAVVFGDARLLLWAVQYIPVSAALAWSYERTGTVWTSIFVHMIINSMAFAVMNML